MNPMTFDQISKIFAEHRLSRRQVFQRATGGSATGLLGTTAGTTAARPASVPATGSTAALKSFRLYRSAETSATAVATPAVSEASKPTTFMFVQSFDGGSLVPQPGQDGKQGKYTLTLPHGLGDTVYFSDRRSASSASSPPRSSSRGSTSTRPTRRTRCWSPSGTRPIRIWWCWN